MTDIGDRLRAQRERYPMTQHELALKAGVNRVTVANLERSVSDSPRPSTIRKLAAALDVDAGWLMTGDEGKEAA